MSTNSKINNGAFLKEIIYLNNPNKTAKLLIYLFSLKANIGKLSYSDQSLFDQGLNHIVDEIAVVTDTPTEKVKEKLLKGIQR